MGKLFFLLFCCAIGACPCQAQEHSISTHDRQIIKEINPPSNRKISNRDAWLEEGRIQEEKFNRNDVSEIQTDSSVMKTFIIERNPNIRIDHTPSPLDKKNTW